MKFNNGRWLMQEGTCSFSPSLAHSIQKESAKITICAPTHPVSHHGEMMDGVILTLVITSPLEGILRVQTFHHLGSLPANAPSFALLDGTVPLHTSETDDCITIASGNLALEIGKKNWYMKYLRDGKCITSSASGDLSLIKRNWNGFYYDRDGDMENTYIRQQLSIGIDEYIYGLGERFTPLVKNGQSVDCWNMDGGTSTEQSYKNIPFFISNQGYGVLVNHTENVSFEVGSEYVTRTAFSVKGGYLDYFLIAGNTMKEVLGRYTILSGKPALPPAWTFGLWLSTSFTTSYDEETVMSFINGMLDRGIPLRTFHFDCFWMKGFHWSEFIWDADIFPDPVGMLRRIKAKGLSVCVWINPYIGQESAIFDEGLKNGYFLKRPNGQVWQWDMWQPGMAIVDFTNPDAYDWYQQKLETLLDMGVDCFKTDFGERIPTDVIYFDGSDPVCMHNYYTYLYNQCVYELLERKLGKGNAVLFARSATAGGQKFPVHWGGDCFSNYESMAESLRGGLSLCMSGFGFWAHDIGGFENTSTADVYKRWVAFGLLSSHSRLHGSSSYRVPWHYDEEAVQVLRFFTRLKARLMPYLFKTATDTSHEGIPMMRSMVMEFTSDKTCAYLDKQYMMGDNLLVAPIFRKDGIASYYLPKGIWTHFLTGKEYKGGTWYEESYDYFSLPLMVKENAMLVLGDCDTKPDYDYANHCEVRIYALHDGRKITTDVYSTDGIEELSVCARRDGHTITITSDGFKPYTIRMVNMHAKHVRNGFLVTEGNDTLITPENGANVIELTF